MAIHSPHRQRAGSGPAWLAMTLAVPMLACVAHAEPVTHEAPQAATLAPVKVSGQDEDAGEGSATLGKQVLRLREIPQSVSVIGQQQMQEQNLQSLDEVMHHATGITVQPYQLLTTAYYARGFKVDSFEQDGVPVLMGNMAAAPQDMAVYERVEILRGANGLMHGAGNPAATVNLVRKRPQREFAFRGSVQAGSWDRYRAEADLGGPLNERGNVRGRLVTAYEDRGYFYDVAEQKTALFYGIGEIDLSPDTVLTAGVEHQRIRSITNMAGVPRYADGGDIGLKRSTYLDVDWDRFDWNTTRWFADVEHQFGNGWRARISANYLKADSKLKYAGAYGAIDRETGLGSRLMGEPTSSTTARPAWTPTPPARWTCSGAGTNWCSGQCAAGHQRAAHRGAAAGVERAGRRVPLGSARCAGAGHRPLPLPGADEGQAAGRVCHGSFFDSRSPDRGAGRAHELVESGCPHHAPAHRP
ncbi:TonB-dependent outer membrane receptor [Bordetella trematum]|nr:TonB-dependent outer membrane receptor [Bordetella trematum]